MESLGLLAGEEIMLLREERISPASCMPEKARVLSEALYASPHSWASARVRSWKRVVLDGVDEVEALWIEATLRMS